MSVFWLLYAHFHPGRANCPQRAANLTAPSGFLCGAARGPSVLLRRPESGVAMRIKRYEVVPGSTLERGPPFFDKPTPSTQFRCVSCPNVFTVPGDERHAVDNGGALGKWKSAATPRRARDVQWSRCKRRGTCTAHPQDYRLVWLAASLHSHVRRGGAASAAAVRSGISSSELRRRLL